MSLPLGEQIELARASAWVGQKRPTRWVDAAGVKYPAQAGVDNSCGGSREPDSTSYEWVDLPETVHNVITTVGRDFIHTQSYGTSPAGNGLNYIALSNDAVTENSASTTLSNEIAANGLSRVQGTVVHTTGQNTTTVDRTFTCATAPQAAQKAALFTAGSGGTMNHVLGFTQRSLQIGDTLQITFTITLG